jgi:hypothetical protein
MTRAEALALVNAQVGNRNLVKHMLATEACMRALAGHFGEDVEEWGLAGLLHDLDYDQTAKDFANHGLKTAEMLAGRVGEKVIHAIKAHPGHVPALSRFDQALYAVDPITGLIVAAALMAPEKKLANVDREFVLRRYKERKFAAGANREQIASCSRFGLTLENFTGLCLEAMKGIAPELGL